MLDICIYVYYYTNVQINALFWRTDTMFSSSSSRSEKFAWTISLLSFGYLAVRIGLGLLTV